MRTDHRRLAWVGACVGMTLAGCFSPSDERPGFGLRGDVVESLPTDWSFTDAHREIAIQVRSPYLLPHAVTIWCASLDGALYVGAREPATKSWPGWVDRNPDVRLGIGERIYEVRLTPLEDPDRIASLRRAYAAKYALPQTPASEAPPIRYWRVGPRG